MEKFGLGNKMENIPITREYLERLIEHANEILPKVADDLKQNYPTRRGDVRFLQGYLKVLEDELEKTNGKI